MGAWDELDTLVTAVNDIGNNLYSLIKAIIVIKAVFSTNNII